MSGIYPTTPKVARVTLQSTQPTRVTVAHSLKRQARTRGAQRWVMKFGYPSMTRAELSPLYAFLLSQRGQADTFTAVLPGYTAAQGSWSGAPVVNGTAQSGRSISLRGFTPSQSGVAKAGDLIKFNGQSKVYMVTADSASDSSGFASVSIEPTLISSPADGEVLISSNVPFTVACAGDNLPLTMSPGVLYDIEVDLVEVW